MSTRRRLFPALLIALVPGACGGSSTSSQVPVSRPTSDAATDPAIGTAPVPGPTGTPARQLTTETVVTTSWGATVTVPASFYVQESPDVLRLQDPEREVQMAMVAVKAPDRDAAIAQAWKTIAPGFALAVAQAQDAPGRGGWDAMAQVVYVTKTEESRVVLALARRKGDTWHIATIDGKLAAIDRRGAQMNALVLDMKVPGLDEESFAGKAPNLDAAHLAKFDAFVEEARKLSGVPGVAIAVVHGGKVVLEKGYGLRAMSKRQKVTPSTLFAIGSTTKSLTTVMLARLVDAGRFGWDTPVAQVLPEFQLADPEITKKVQVQHTVCACTGMPRQDYEFLFEYSAWDPERRLASMATMKPTTGFGETFQYSNLMVATGGWIGARVHAPAQKLGPAYDSAMRTLVLGPLGMKATTFDIKAVTRADHARPHGKNLELAYLETPIDYETAVVAVRPAGAAWSNVRDMARYMMLELARGKTPDGTQLVTEANMLARRTPRVKIDEDSSYGLGLFLSKDHDLEVVHHGGNMLGYTSDLFLIPKHDIGVVVLTNGGGANSLRGAIRRSFLETVFEGTPEARENLETSIASSRTALEAERALIKPAHDAWVTPLLGTYENAQLGTIIIRRTGKIIELDAGEWTTSVAKKTDRDGAVKLVTTRPPYVGFELLPKAVDGVTSLVLEAGQHLYTFAPVAKR